MITSTAHAPRPSPCPECSGTRAADASSGVQIVASGSNQSSELRALVCVMCGHTTFYAKEPEHMVSRKS